MIPFWSSLKFLSCTVSPYVLQRDMLRLVPCLVAAVSPYFINDPERARLTGQ
jgi:hypothetical protein